MKIKIVTLIAFCVTLTTNTFHAQETEGQSVVQDSTQSSKWYYQNINVIKSGATRFGPSKTGDLYLEYEFFGRKSFVDFYGYIDFPKFFGTSTDGFKGIWDGGSPLFMDLQPRFSLNSIFNEDLRLGIFKEWYISTNYIGDWGKKSKFGRANNLYIGVGTDIDTHSKLALAANFYVRKVWENYGSPNENSWDGFRIKIKSFYPIGKVLKGDLMYVGYGDYDFGSKLSRFDNRTSSSIVISQALDLSYKHFHFTALGRYFGKGGQFKYENAPFPIYSNGGWGYYLIAGLRF